jgi:hypothetical protein
MDIQPPEQQDRPHPHPHWCDATLCTFDRGVHGSHRSASGVLTLTTGTVAAYLDLGHPPAVPLVVIEQRSCSCQDCEPIAVLTMRTDTATEAVTVLAGLTREMVDDQAARPRPLGGHEPWCSGHHISACSPAGAR